MTRAVLLLEDGTAYHGTTAGFNQRIFGEVVFSTAMSGYQESFTDPSYAGQILVLTYPLVGNYGFQPSCAESSSIQIRGLVIREPAFFSSRGSRIVKFMAECGLPMIWGVDTRALTLRIRDRGTMKGLILPADGPSGIKRLAAGVRRLPHPDRENLVARVSTPKVVSHRGRGNKRIVLIDCGAKRSIVRRLAEFGRVIQVPWNADFDFIRSLRPHGVMISNGPGDPGHPQVVARTVRTIRQLVKAYPVFGICLGHQLLGLALGGRTFKLKFGHRGYNHAVRERSTGKIYITSQNHGYALDPGVKIPDVEYDWFNVNDATVEGLSHKKRPVFSVQFHPEAAPGPLDTAYLFQRFMEMT